MSTILFCWILFLGTYAAAATINRPELNWILPFQNKSAITVDADGTTVYSRNRRIVVEEVDKNGNSVLKELEFPDYEGNLDLEEDMRRREEQEEIYDSQVQVQKKKDPDMYGCEYDDENQRRKCLMQQKKLLKKRYKNWKGIIRRIIKDLDDKIKNIHKDLAKDSKAKNLDFTSGLSQGIVTRKKE